MRVLYVHQYFGTPKGAAGTRSYEMARALVAAGHEVTMVCASSARLVTGLSSPFVHGRREGLVDGIRVIEFSVGDSRKDSIWRRAWRFTIFSRQAIASALREQYDLIFATSTPLTAALPGVVAKWVRRKPFIFEVRDLWPELPRAMGMKNPLMLGVMTVLERSAYAAADKIIALAPGISDGITRTGYPAGRVFLIPNGCDNDMFDAAPPVRPADRFPGLIDQTDFVAVFAGAHGRANGLDAAINAARVLKARGRTDIKLLLIGDGPEKSRLQNEAADLETLRFVGSLPKGQIAGLLKGADVGLQLLADIPAFYNGTSPNKFFDYLAAGLPVLINYPGWLADLTVETGAGWAIPPCAPEAFADNLIAAEADRADPPRRGIAAARLGRDRFSREALAARFVAVLESVGEVSRRPAA